MRIHEFQAKQVLQQFGVPVPEGRVAETAAEARAIAAALGGRVVIKAQVHAGGRGKGGGIRLANSPAEAEQVAAQMIGMTLITPQTGPEGRLVRRVLVEQQMAIERELYLAVLIDSATAQPLMLASGQGGMDIEEVAARDPDAIHRVRIDPVAGFQPHHGRELAFSLGITGDLQRSALALMGGLYRAFIQTDASLAEINPLVTTADGRLLALDAKMNFDDNALFRHPDIMAMRDLHEEDPLEVEAERLGINNYVKLTGNIGCVVNGAGLAMATMDAIKQAGGEPANFLDIGTVNDVNRVVNAFKILTADPSVRAILVNIFGGMARVDIIAEGIVWAKQEMDVPHPIVVRLAGTNLEAGERVLRSANVPVVWATDLYEAALKAVEAAKVRPAAHAS